MLRKRLHWETVRVMGGCNEHGSNELAAQPLELLELKDSRDCIYERQLKKESQVYSSIAHALRLYMMLCQVEVQTPSNVFTFRGAVQHVTGRLSPYCSLAFNGARICRARFRPAMHGQFWAPFCGHRWLHSYRTSPGAREDYFMHITTRSIYKLII